ncbi:unnamed protein product [Fusarium graminearum]|nr:unnamed protein product [Fusarium graminearum]
MHDLLALPEESFLTLPDQTVPGPMQYTRRQEPFLKTPSALKERVSKKPAGRVRRVNGRASGVMPFFKSKLGNWSFDQYSIRTILCT